MSTNQNEEQLLDRFNQQQKKITQNRLILTTTLNFLTLAITIFSMTYYQWAYVTLSIQDNKTQNLKTQSAIIRQKQVQIWLNLLFMKMENQSSYQTYASASIQLCIQADLYCSTFFYQLAFVGGLSFLILACGFMIQIYQFFKLTYFLIKTKLLKNQNFLKSNQFRTEHKNDFRHVVAISTYLISITLNAFGLKLIDSSITFQLCFWLYMSTLLLFIFVIVYARIQMAQIQKQNLILKLIKQEKYIHNQQWEKRNRIHSIQMSSEERKSQSDFGI